MDLLKEIAELAFKALTSEAADLRHKLQIVGSGNDRDMSHVHRQLGELRLDVGTLTIPSDQGLNCEAVTFMPRAA